MSTDPEISSIDSTDPSPYIRTYAKDVAMLTGQKVAPARPAVSQEETSSTTSAQEAEEHLQDMGNAPSSGILQSISLPSIEPGDIVRGVAPMASPVDDTASREEVLARLRSKITESRPAETPLMPSSFSPLPAYEPVSEPAPTKIIPEPLPPLPEEAASSPSPFHSFSSDFADRIDEQHASTFSVLAAEKDMAPRQTAPHKKLALLPIIAGIVLVLAGGVGVFATYHFMTAEAPVATTPSESYLIAPDEKVALSGTSPELLRALAQQAAQPLPTNTVLLTYITSATTTKEGVIQAPADGGAFLAALNLPAPDILLRNIDPTSMIGIVNDGNQTRAFFILRVDSYESSYAGMLDWEPTIASDLRELYPPYPAPVQAVSVVATSTATTTSKTGSATKTTSSKPAPASLPVALPQFIDEVVANHNARALKDAEGRTILIYGYADNQTLIIARDEAAFTLLLERLEASQQ